MTDEVIKGTKKCMKNKEEVVEGKEIGYDEENFENKYKT